MEAMARGFESKSVESQQEAAQARTVEKAPMTAAEQQISALEQTRKRILNEMEASRNQRFLDLKQRALDYVDTQLAELRRSIIARPAGSGT